MPKFRAEILSQNTSTVPKLLAQKFGMEKLAGIFGLKTMPKFHAERIGLKWHFGGQMYRASFSYHLAQSSQVIGCADILR